MFLNVFKSTLENARCGAFYKSNSEFLCFGRALKDADLEKRIKMHALAVQSASRPSEGASMHELGAMSASAAAVNGKGPHVKSGGTHGQMSLADAKRDLDIVSAIDSFATDLILMILLWSS